MDNNKYAFNEKEPELGAYICVYWKDGSECECIYDGLDKSLTPLPTHWCYVTELQIVKS